MENFRLKVFRTVAQHLSFRRAADDLFITQPAVTQQIKALEDEVGLPLFDRSGGRVVLTRVGEILLRYTLRLKATVDEALQAIAEESQAFTGRLSVGASQTIGQYLLPNLMAGFLRENPRVEITAMSGNTETVLEALAAHTIDVALIEGPTRMRHVVVEPFMEDHLVLVAPAGHEWAEHEIDLATLATGPLLMREQGSGSRRVVEEALEAAGVGLKHLKVTMTLDSTEGLLSGVEAGLGMAFVSRWAVRNQLTLGTLKIVRVNGLRMPRMFSIAYAAGPPPVGNAGAFHRFVLAQASSWTPRTTGVARKPKQPGRDGR